MILAVAAPQAIIFNFYGASIGFFNPVKNQKLVAAHARQLPFNPRIETVNDRQKLPGPTFFGSFFYQEKNKHKLNLHK